MNQCMVYEHSDEVSQKIIFVLQGLEGLLQVVKG